MGRIGSFVAGSARLTALGASLAVLVTFGPAALVAQEDGMGKVEITRLDVPAHQMLEFQAAVGLLVEAAEAAEMGEEFTWWLHQGNGYYTVVSPVRTMARFDDPEAFIRAIKGTPGEATMEEFTAAIAKIDYRSNNQVADWVADWSFTPEDGLSREEAGLLHVLSFRMRPGMQETLTENIRSWTEVMGRVGFPYVMDGYRTLLGDGGRGYLVFHADNRANVYGKNDLRTLMAAKGMEAEYDRLVGELLDCLSEYEWVDEEYVPELSYAPGTS